MADQPTITLRGKAYGVVRKLGDTACCRSFLVEADGRRHVLKVYRAPMAVSFDREAARLAKVRPVPSSLILPEDSGPSGEERYLLRPWIDATSFDAYTRGFMIAPRKIEPALAMGQALCRAVAPLHAAGLGHGRLTNNNVFFDADGAPVVTDALIGTTGAAPTPAGDVAQLGLLLCRIFTRRPELTVNDRTLMELHKARVPLSLIRVLWQAIQPRPEDRFADAATLATALAEVTAAEHLRTVYVRPTPLAAAPAMDEGVSPGVRNAALLVLALGLVSLGAWWWGARRAPDSTEVKPATSILAAVTATKPAPEVAVLPVPPPATPTPQADPFAPGSSAGERLVVTIAPGVEMAFRWIPPGSFTMGSPANEEGRENGETQHTVTLTNGFWMAETETTQAQWQAVMGNNPSQRKGATLPVEQVDWDDATAFCRTVSGRLSAQVSLPTEEQWEYACRAGTTTPYHSGSNEAALDRAGWWYDDKGGHKPRPVGQKEPNAAGLRDMHGNVAEWCLNSYTEYGAQDGAASGEKVGRPVFRGGSWGNLAAHCRAANRDGSEPGKRNAFLGFRVVALPDAPSPSTPRPAATIPQSEPAAHVNTGSLSKPSTTLGQRRVVQIAAGVDMAFRWMPPGSFLIGSPPQELTRDPSEGPQTQVRIKNGYWIGETEVTVSAWDAFVKDTGVTTEAEQSGSSIVLDNGLVTQPGINWRSPGFAQEENHPVVCVSRKDIGLFCDWLETKLKSRFLLPSEAEWEYACRGGSTSSWYWGDSPEEGHQHANLADKDFYESRPPSQVGKWQDTFIWSDGFVYTAPVGTFLPNAAGLFDMHGNVHEMTRSMYGSYPGREVDDESWATPGLMQICRGGSWGSKVGFSRAASRSGGGITPSSNVLGFRLISYDNPPVEPPEVPR